MKNEYSRGVLLIGGWLFASFAACSAAARPAEAGPWIDLFDGRGLSGWQITEFGGEGEVVVADGRLILRAGEPLTGITWGGEFPRRDFEISLRGARLSGLDFFGALTFPVGAGHCTLVLGGWGGVVVGLSSIDGFDADDNATRRLFDFEDGRYYHVRLRVSATHISAWIDGDRVVHQEIDGHVFSLHPQIVPCEPLGLASFATDGAFLELRWRTLQPDQG